MRIDLNCDLGEGAPSDAELMPLITSANIACCGHVGDAASMERTLELAKRFGVSAGAHPGYPDHQHFGRREMNLSSQSLRAFVEGQIHLLRMFAEYGKIPLRHVKPHGALYNQSARDLSIANDIAASVHSVDPSLVLYGLAGSLSITSAEAIGLKTAREVFADRRYQPDGSLVPRTHPDALITDPAESCTQVLRFIREGMADTVCLHGDGPHAVTFAKALRSALHTAGVEVRAFGS